MKKIKYYLFGFIPILKMVQRDNKVKVYLFNFILIYKYKILDYTPIKRALSVQDIIGLSSDSKMYIDIATERVDNKTILLVEPNMQYHSECLPGYVKLLNDLNYNVHILMCNENVRLGALSRCQNLNFKVFGCNSYKSMIAVLNTDYIKNRYKKIIITTSLDNTGRFALFDLDFQNNINCILHSIKTIEEFSLHDLVNNKRAYVLSYFNNNLLTVNPHYYGEIVVTPKNEDIVQFVTVGRIQKDVKNYSMLIDSVESLIKEGVKNFKVNIIGWTGEFDVKEELKQYINFLGKLDFPNMYSILEKSDYILSLLDCNDKNHLLYTKDITTGSNQLVLGFKKPYVISEIYANAYKYTNESAIIYNDNNLYQGMKNAIKLSTTDYVKMQTNINIFANKLDEISRRNLGVTINA